MLNLDNDGKITDVKIADFGLSRRMTQKFIAGRDTRGTAAYMAPEMIPKCSTFDQLVESWSLGVILYRMLTFKLPFIGKNALETIK